MISLGNEWSSYRYKEKDLGILKTKLIFTDKVKRSITCANGYGASFNYLHTSYSISEYGTFFYQKELFKNGKDPSWEDAIDHRRDSYVTFKSEYSSHSNGKFELKIPMDVATAKSYITSDEKKLNGKLKFIVKFKPSFPFYNEDINYNGDRCGGEYNNRGGTSSTFYTTLKYALVDIYNLKLVDSSTGTVLLERNYQ